jgi:hypothetical protein
MFTYALEVERDGADFLAKFSGSPECFGDRRTYEEAVSKAISRSAIVMSITVRRMMIN